MCGNREICYFAGIAQHMPVRCIQHLKRALCYTPPPPVYIFTDIYIAPELHPLRACYKDIYTHIYLYLKELHIYTMDLIVFFCKYLNNINNITKEELITSNKKLLNLPELM